MNDVKALSYRPNVLRYKTDIIDGFKILRTTPLNTET